MSPRVAAVDIGTNTVRLLIATVAVEGDRSRIVDAQRREVITKLGEGLDATGRLGDGAMKRSLDGLRGYAARIRDARIDLRAAVATAATRSAENGGGFIGMATEVLGFRPRVIDGVEEARLTFTGAVSQVAGDGVVCVIDVGGGSTEFVVGRSQPDYAMSIDIGSVRLTERIGRLGLTSVDAVREYVDSLYAGVHPPYDADVLLGSGGTYVSLGGLYHGLSKAAVESAPGLTVSMQQIVQTVDRLWDLTVDEIAQLPAVLPARAPVFTAGAICAERAVAHVGVPAVTISIADILDGIALELANG
jgi:exopolyphosphatase/guanosine-5'-triphosphate,3'-diphosphate pyrophosphatase